jgi:membrane associated rhomboid family serine protease
MSTLPADAVGAPLRPAWRPDRASAGVTGKEQEGWRVMRLWTTKRPEERHSLWTALVLFLLLLLLALPVGAFRSMVGLAAIGALIAGMLYAVRASRFWR